MLKSSKNADTERAPVKCVIQLNDAAAFDFLIN